MKLIREMPDLYRLVSRAPINSYFVREDHGLTLVDANLPGRATQVVEIALKLHSEATPGRASASNHVGSSFEVGCSGSSATSEGGAKAG